LHPVPGTKCNITLAATDILIDANGYIGG